MLSPTKGRIDPMIGKNFHNFRELNLRILADLEASPFQTV